MTSDTIDYEDVAVPPEKDPTDYTYVERRADILDEIRAAGHPRLVNQKRLAERYGCAPSNVHNDMEVLAEYVAAGLSDRHALVTEAVFSRALEEGEWRKAAKTAGDYADWVRDRQEMDALAERIEELEKLAADHPTGSPHVVGGWTRDRDRR